MAVGKEAQQRRHSQKLRRVQQRVQQRIQKPRGNSAGRRHSARVSTSSSAQLPPAAASDKSATAAPQYGTTTTASSAARAGNNFAVAHSPAAVAVARGGERYGQSDGGAQSAGLCVAAGEECRGSAALGRDAF